MTESMTGLTTFNANKIDKPREQVRSVHDVWRCDEKKKIKKKHKQIFLGGGHHDDGHHM